LIGQAAESARSASLPLNGFLQVPRSAEISAIATAADALWALPDRGQTTTRLDKIKNVKDKLRMSSSTSLSRKGNSD